MASKLVLVIFVATLGLAWSQEGHYSTWEYQDPDSEEYGQSKGDKGTNCTCGTTNKAGGRVVGGRETKVNEYPHMAGLSLNIPNQGYKLFCGSTIITPYHLVTAAHCTHDLPPRAQLAVLVGGHDVQNATKHTKLYELSTYIEHPNYDPGTFRNDIAMLVVKEAIKFGQAVGPACLPTSPTTKALVGQYVKVTGWGDTSYGGAMSKVLMKVNLRVVPLDQCAARYRRGNIDVTNPSQICTFRTQKDSCQGDSGGPVTWLDPETNRYTLVGAVSYGRGCAFSTPGVNTDIFTFLPWIQQIVESTPSGNGAQTCAKIG